MRIKFHVAAGLITVVFAAAAFVLMGYLFDSRHEQSAVQAEPDFAVISAAQAETLTIDTLPEPEPAPMLPEKPSLITHVRDLYVEDNRVWVATPDGLLQTDRNGQHYRLIDSADGVDPRLITGIVRLPGRILFYTCDGYYEYLGPDVFREVKFPLFPPIRFCPAFDSLSYVGSYEDGIFQYTPDSPVLLKSDLLVTAIVFCPDGLWVGTDGDGLWRFDGETWQKRFLRSDTNAFDYVTALNYHWPHLMVGTPGGLYRFDGGAWDIHTGDSSDFPGGWISDIAFANHRWYVGTVDDGLWGMVGSSFFPVEELAGKSITRIKVFRDDVYVGTQTSGVYVRRAGQWRSLYLPEKPPEIPRQLLTLL